MLDGSSPWQTYKDLVIYKSETWDLKTIYSVKYEDGLYLSPELAEITNLIDALELYER